MHLFLSSFCNFLRWRFERSGGNFQDRAGWASRRRAPKVKDNEGFSIHRIVKVVLRFLAAALFIGAGVDHFYNAEFFRRIVPPMLPAAGLLVALSGVADITGGVGLLIKPLRQVAGWGLILLLIAVFPANINMAVHTERFPEFSPGVLWLRLPLQILLVACVYFVSKSPPDRS